MTTPPRILSIAGSDSSGGAGIQADVKTITMLGGYAMTAITAITTQDTTGIHAVEVLSPEIVEAQIGACLKDIGVDAVKIGMLGSAANAHRVADLLQGVDVPIVFDPVMIASSSSSATIAAFERLIRLATLTTPNVAELAALGGEDGRAAPRVVTRHTHGTGCTLSSAIATFLGQGKPLEQAAEHARTFVQLALRDAPGLGAGHGPLGHAAVRLDMTGEPRLNQITVAATDYAASVAFYRALGLTQIVDSTDNGYARFESPGGATLSIATYLPAGGGSAAVYFECLDLEGMIARLASTGIAVEPAADQDWLWTESWLSDPAGNRICLYRAGVNRRHPPWRIG
jgi:hydroxymethylpyrimidine/phosphomethylpyrimidine kinase